LKDINDEFLKIISAKENKDAIRDKMYRNTYEELEKDDIDIDTALVDEYIETVKLIDDIEDIPEKKIQEMNRRTEQRYKQLESKIKKKRLFMKNFRKIAASFVILLLITGVVASANGYNILKTITKWGNEIFYFNVKGDVRGRENGKDNNSANLNGLVDSKIYYNIDDAIKDIAPKPILPSYIPVGYTLEYIERTDLDKKVLLSVVYLNQNKELLINLSINKGDENINYNSLIEKDSSEVEIYKKNNIEHYIMKNYDNIQGTWVYNNTVYLIIGEISMEETKTLIDSVYN
jgi:hypothetical protein